MPECVEMWWEGLKKFAKDGEKSLLGPGLGSRKSRCVLDNPATKVVPFCYISDSQWTGCVYEELVGGAGQRGGAWANVGVHASQHWNWLEYEPG